MKNLFGLIFLILVGSGCGFLGKKDGTATNNKTVSNTATKPETTTEKSISNLTLDKFNQLQNGMKYDDVVKILGSEGTETSSFSSGSLKTVTYKWEGEKYARITVTFKNDALSSKIQSGLKSADGNASATKSDLTLAKYNRMQSGISYEEAVKIIGSEGTQSSNSTVGQMKIASYKWEGEKSAKIFATFKDNKLSSKSQINLK